MTYITTDDNTKLYVKEYDGGGRPVILLHGFPLSADSWEDQAVAFAEAGFRVIAYDRRGFGRSEQTWNGYDYDSLTDDLAAVIKETKATDATLAGFSMGGGEVARYMSRYKGQNVAQAALVSSVVPFMLKTENNPNGTDKSVFEDMLKQIRADRAAFFAAFFKDFYGIGYITQPISDEIIEASWIVAMQSSLRATIECVKSFGATDFRPDLAAFNVPTLIIHGTGDKTVPIDAAGRAAAQGIANSRLLEYDDAPHGLLATHKDQVTAELLAFLSEV